MLDLAGLTASLEVVDKIVERINGLVKKSHDRQLKQEVSKLMDEIISLKKCFSSTISEAQRLETELAKLKSNQQTEGPSLSFASSPSLLDDAIKGKL